MSREGTVVLLVLPRYLQHRTDGTWAARFPELGLTAYGPTREDALSRLKQMLGMAVEAHRMMGNLETWLNQTGATWRWYTEYDGFTPVEHVGKSVGVPPAKVPVPTVEWEDMDTLGMAA